MPCLFYSPHQLNLVQPTGRTIQVECSLGERLPSVDVRRPRLRDSDAVIQVVKLLASKNAEQFQ